ncbi:MAG TPA: Lpg1974 family pore-forming outer membrane protein, partial [Pirellulaceae bacterium]
MQVRFLCARSVCIFVALASVVRVASIDAEDIRFITEDAAIASVSDANSPFVQSPVIAAPVITAPAAPADTISTNWNYGSGFYGCQACPPCGWFADAGLYVLQPRWATNQAMAVLTPLGGGRFSLTNIDFKYGFNGSPFLNLGYVAQCGLGFRVGYWDFRGDSTANFTSTGGSIVSSAAPLSLTVFGVPNPMQVTTRLAFQVWDCEATQQLDGFGGLWTVSGGVRYLHMLQTYDVTTFGAAGTRDDLASSHSLNAAGPTLALKGRTQLGNSNFSLYASARNSLVFGANAQEARQFAANGSQGNESFQSSRSLANISELDVGVGYQW